MIDWADGDKIVAAMYGTGEINYFSEVIGYMAEPTYVLKRPDGRTQHWAASLVREATPEETIAYWRDRALKAEQKKASDVGG